MSKSKESLKKTCHCGQQFSTCEYLSHVNQCCIVSNTSEECSIAEIETEIGVLYMGENQLIRIKCPHCTSLCFFHIKTGAHSHMEDVGEEIGLNSIALAVRKIHENEKCFSCQKLIKGKKGDLTIYVKRFHNPDVFRQTPFRCLECDKTFPNRERLEKHIICVHIK